MEKYNDIIAPMKKRYVSMYLEIEKLEGMFQDATAGGLVWKERKNKAGFKQKGKRIGFRKYAYYQYYDKRKQRGKRKIQRYIRKDELSWAMSLIRTRRNQWSKLKELKKEIKRIAKGLRVFSVFAEELRWEIKAAKMKKALKKTQKMPFKGRCRYLTSRGELVRSRAERKIANALFQAGILYEYESPIWKGNIRILPDFLIHMDGKKYIWEHLGMLEVPEYADKWERKKLFYSKIGFIEGKNLIVTTEKNIDFISLEKIFGKIKK